MLNSLIIFLQNIKLTANKSQILKTNDLYKVKDYKSYYFYTLNNVLITRKISLNFKSLINTKSYIYNFVRFVTDTYFKLRSFYWRSFSFGFYYIQGFCFLLFIDACLTDDEPLWEPIEWSLVQTWILFIFIFGWIAENLIVSRYGSYTGRDKRVWMAWYKTFWLIEIYYVINFAAAACFVITPFYFETSYILPFIYTWWNWYSRSFFLNLYPCLR